MHWTLDTVRDLTTDDFDELVMWLQDRAKKDDDGIDADVMLGGELVKAQKEADGRR